MAAARYRLRAVREAFATNLRCRDLRRVQLAFGAAWTSEWALTVGLGIVAFRDGGAGAVASSPCFAWHPARSPARSWRRSPIGCGASTSSRRSGWCAVSPVAAMAVLLAVAAPTASVYALAVVATIAGTPLRAAHSALLPSQCRTPELLTSANAVRGMVDSLSTLIGPLIAAVLLGVGSARCRARLDGAPAR